MLKVAAKTNYLLADVAAIGKDGDLLRNPLRVEGEFAVEARQALEQS